MGKMEYSEFQELIWQKARELYRDMPWRSDPSPYNVLVSEIMLQQTQVDRVIPKFLSFIADFPSIKALEARPLADVLTAWNGLGYNRRAKYLHEAARKAVTIYGGELPQDYQSLVGMPGIGHNTAAAILVYAYNQPRAFVETNIRTVFFHHFFQDQADVNDKQVLELVEATMDREYPREWFWALMDYGTFLKRQGIRYNSKSVHYKRQLPLKGSVREVRGQIIRILTQESLSRERLELVLKADDRFETALGALEKEGLIIQKDNVFHLTK